MKGIYLVLLMCACIHVKAGKLSRETRDALQKYSIEEFYKLKYCSTVVYMVPRA